MSGYDTYENKCGSCRNLNINDYCGSKNNCKCTRRGGYHELSEKRCSSDRDYDGPVPDGTRWDERDYRALKNRWYIVSAICKKLGLSDEYECVSLLQNFRVNVLEKDDKYNEVLEEYDIVGPFIAQMLLTDEDSKELCERLLQVYLVKVLDLIKTEKYDEALNRYVEMVNLLRTIYQVDEIKQDNNSSLIKTL